MSPEDQYPSTDDCAPILNAGDNAVALCIQNAKDRYNMGPSRGCYIEKDNVGGPVCAIGALWAVGDGEEEEIAQQVDHLTGLWSGKNLAAEVEKYLREEAIEAIRFCNEAARELHPEMDMQVGSTGALDLGRWTGPLEWVNQSWVPDGFDAEDDYEDGFTDAVFAEVNRVYDRAIELALAAQPA